MSPGIWRGIESSDSYFILWWLVGILASWLLAKEPGYYGSKLHALINYRIFLQGIRQKGQESSLISKGWTLVGYSSLGLTLTGLPHFQRILWPLLPEALRNDPVLVLLWIIVLSIASGFWGGFLRVWAWVAEFDEGFLWLKASFYGVFHALIPFMLVLPLLTRFGTPSWIAWAYALSLGLLGLAVGFRWVRLLRLANELSIHRLFLMVFYICTFEIIPITMIAMK